MKPALILFAAFCFSCTQPKHVTFNPDDRAATSGTLGSAKSTTGLPTPVPDSSARKDSLPGRKDFPQ